LRISGGEKQRIAISRIIVKNPPLLILDEGMSSQPFPSLLSHPVSDFCLGHKNRKGNSASIVWHFERQNHIGSGAPISHDCAIRSNYCAKIWTGEYFMNIVLFLLFFYLLLILSISLSIYFY
jgi:ABC-type iron transport system FetAB ATPase subunit